MTRIYHVVGAGIAGLAASVALAGAGGIVHIYEATPQAGGRCRSFRDPVLNRVIDNGTHLLLGANRQSLNYLQAIGGMACVNVCDPIFPFLDAVTQKHWTVTPRHLGAKWWETAKALGLPWIGPSATVAQHLASTPNYRTLWRPLCVSALNSPADQASARCFARLLRALVLGGPQAMRPYTFPQGLSAAFIDPAIALLSLRNATFHFRTRLREITDTTLEFAEKTVEIGPNDRVILAVPHWAAKSLVPNLPSLASQAIANIHFQVDQPITLPGGQSFLSVIGAHFDWLSVRGDIISATLSSWQGTVDHAALWQDIAKLCALPPSLLPLARLIHDRRATLLHSPQAMALRPPARTHRAGLFLAGDWVHSAWPCTLEAAIGSGLTAARLAMDHDGLAFPC